ncbi:hypothetical protein AK812_SmicGene28538 [Symbiodinium microadriaticum]|uniref:Uncharacterized protein n=1 Tax=Symbiodinium microadriaticum TaxID=2951 RepID=A0A1Q9D478_SYMMI|nr:hypothetical protein AK812_SmicGene28538 [Symbiodinium microadriaticum]
MPDSSKGRFSESWQNYERPGDISGQPQCGEIKNSNGYSTNAIEAKWSLLKRWAHRKLGGKLPSHSDRVKWH